MRSLAPRVCGAQNRVHSFVRTFATRTPENSVENGVWSDFSKRPQSLQVSSPALKDQLLNGVPEKGPVLLKLLRSKRAYKLPIGLDEIFPLAYKVLEKEAAAKYAQLESLEKTPENRKLAEKLLIDAEKHNPQVLYTAQFTDPAKFDLDHPVFRYYYEKNHFDLEKMKLMQRVEQMHVLPDALPTIDPKVEFSVSFVGLSGVVREIEAGSILPTSVTAKPPSFKAVYLDSEKEFSSEDRFTIVAVNLDVPDLETNGYTSYLHYGVKNVQLPARYSVLDFETLALKEFVEYMPPVPEKNVPANRIVCLLLRQQQELGDLELTREGFDIREFIGTHGLEPVGITFWRNKWDTSVKSVREMYGLPAGRVFHRVRR